jgi:hypothetical protein
MNLFSISNHFSLTLGLERFVKSDSVSAAASSSLKIGVVVCDSEALRRMNEIHHLECATIYLVIFRIRIDCDHISQHQRSLTKRGVGT